MESYLNTIYSIDSFLGNTLTFFWPFMIIIGGICNFRNKEQVHFNPFVVSYIDLTNGNYYSGPPLPEIILHASALNHLTKTIFFVGGILRTQNREDKFNTNIVLIPVGNQHPKEYAPKNPIFRFGHTAEVLIDERDPSN
jgi:hypothetical protein